MARGDSPAQATSYNPHNSISVSDNTPGAAADIVINFSIDAPDSFPNVKTNSSIQFLPEAWGIHNPPTQTADGTNIAPPETPAQCFNGVDDDGDGFADDGCPGGVAGTFNALTNLAILGAGPCWFTVPVPFTMNDANPDTSVVTSTLDVAGNIHPGGPGYSGQFVNDPVTVQTPGDLGLPLITFRADEKYNYPAGPNYDYQGVQATAYRDVDGSNTVSPGDIRLTNEKVIGGNEVLPDYPAGSVVQPGDPRVGWALVSFNKWFNSNDKHTDPNGNGVMDPGERIYKDLNQPWLSKVSYGDKRLFALDPLPWGSIVAQFALPGGVTRYPDFLNQMFPPDVVGQPLARMFGAKDVLGTAVSLNIVTYRPGQLPGYPASLGYPNIVVLLDPVAPIEVYAANLTSDMCTPLSLTSTNLGVSKDNPGTLANEAGYVRLTNPAGPGEKDHKFTLVTTSMPDADDDNIENMLDTCARTPNVGFDGHNFDDPDLDGLDNACDPDPNNPSAAKFAAVDEDQDNYGNGGDNCPVVSNGVQILDLGIARANAFTFSYAIPGDLIGPNNQLDTDGDDIGDACEGAETGAQCLTDADDDGDGAVNDGCPRAGDLGAETGDQCSNAIDDDGDGAVNDGCPAHSNAETGDQCLNDLNDDGDQPYYSGTRVNDGCPAIGAPETSVGWFGCNNDLDDDGDGLINDGCPQYPEFSGEYQCDDAVDNDWDGYVNDGCPVAVTLGAVESGDQCNNNTDDDGDGVVNDGCPAVDPGDVAKTTITGHMHVVTLTQKMTFARHGIKLNQLGGPKNVNSGARTYSVDVSNLGSSAEDVQVGLRVVEGCAAVSGPSSVGVAADGSATASFTVDFTGCAAGTYTVQADACHAGDAAPAGLFGSGACPGTNDGMTDPNALDDAPMAKSVEVGSP